jgi:hypothetical protein
VNEVRRRAALAGVAAGELAEQSGATPAEVEKARKNAYVSELEQVDVSF